MNEQSKSHNSRLRNGDYRFLRGSILDIGCGPDPIKLPPPAVVTGWDLKDGDAQYLATLKDESFDAVVSSHCLEHMVCVPTSLKNWARVLKTGGYMSISVPSWLAYERCQWPSRYNGDHKSSFDLIDPVVRPDHNFYSMRDMRRIGLECGLTLEDARMELDNYDLARTWDTSFDQTRGNALAQVTFVFFKA